MPIFDLKKRVGLKDAFNYILKLQGKIIKIEEKINTRTTAQNDARWLYLTKIAEILNERGETFTPIGMTANVPFNKDNLYHMHWETLRKNLYPGKKRQLNTKEFSNLVDVAQMFYAQRFSISIPFPSIQTKLDDEL